VPGCPHTSRMTAPRANAGKPWTDADDAVLRRLAEMNTPPKLMADRLGRSLVPCWGEPPDLGSLFRRESAGVAGWRKGPGRPSADSWRPVW
jgi:hypothetical protein